MAELDAFITYAPACVSVVALLFIIARLGTGPLSSLPNQDAEDEGQHRG